MYLVESHRKTHTRSQVPTPDRLVVLKIPDHSRNLFSQIAMTSKVLYALKRVFESHK